jgi:hypothetical protein
MYTKEHLNKKRTGKKIGIMYNMYTNCKFILPAARLVHKGYTVTNIKFARQERCKEMIEGKKGLK